MFGDSRKANSATVFDDRVAAAAQVNVDVDTVVHAELSARDNKDAVLYACYMSWPFHLPTYKKTFFDALDCQTGKRFTIRGRDRHVHYAVTQRRDGGWHCGF